MAQIAAPTMFLSSRFALLQVEPVEILQNWRSICTFLHVEMKTMPHSAHLVGSLRGRLDRSLGRFFMAHPPCPKSRRPHRHGDLRLVGPDTCVAAAQNAPESRSGTWEKNMLGSAGMHAAYYAVPLPVSSPLTFWT